MQIFIILSILISFYFNVDGFGHLVKNTLCANICLDPFFVYRAFKSGLLPLTDFKTSDWPVQKVYIVHWGGNPARLQRLFKDMKNTTALQFPLNFIDPVLIFDRNDTKFPPLKVVEALGGKDFAQGKGSHSMSLQHLMAYFDMLVRNYTTVLILEDDIEPINAATLWADITILIDELNTLGTWSSVHLVGDGRLFDSVDPIVWPHRPSPHLRGPARKGIGSLYSQAYLISQLGAKLALIYGAKFTGRNPDHMLNKVASSTQFTTYFTTLFRENKRDSGGTWL